MPIRKPVVGRKLKPYAVDETTWLVNHRLPIMLDREDHTFFAECVGLEIFAGSIQDLKAELSIYLTQQLSVEFLPVITVFSPFATSYYKLAPMQIDPDCTLSMNVSRGWMTQYPKGEGTTTGSGRRGGHTFATQPLIVWCPWETPKEERPVVAERFDNTRGDERFTVPMSIGPVTILAYDEALYGALVKSQQALKDLRQRFLETLKSERAALPSTWAPGALALE